MSFNSNNIQCRSFIDSFIKDNKYNEFFKEKAFIFLCLPHMMVTDEFKPFIDDLILKSNGDNDTLVALMYKIRKIIDIPYGTFSDTKLAIRNILREDPKLDPKYENALRDKINKIVSAIRDFQSENKLLESVMANVAPIVPYSGTICPMWNDGTTPMSSLKNMYYVNAKTYLIDFTNAINNMDSSLESAYDILLDLYLDFGLYISGNTGLAPITKDEHDLIDLIKISNGIPPQIDSNMKLYYLLAHFVFYYRDKWKIKCLEFLTAHSNVYLNNANSYNDLFAYIRNSISLDINMTATEFWDEMGMKDEEYQKLLDVINEVDKYKKDDQDKDITFDIQKMISYLHNNKHIQTDKFANTEFLERYKGKNIENVSYYEGDIMSVIIKDIVLIPYLDLANDYQLRLLCMDKDGKIFTKSMKEV